LQTITNWKEVDTVLYGIAFKKIDATALDEVVTNEADAKNWLNVAKALTRAEIIGYSSPTIEEKTKEFLSNCPFFSSAKLPKTSTEGWSNWGHCVLNGYKWSKQLNWETDRWDVSNGYEALYKFRFKQPAVYWFCNIDTGEVERLFGGRWHQCGMLISLWTKFMEVGEGRAWSAVNMEWNNLNQNYWKNDHYIYAPEWPDWEMRFDMVATNIIKAYRLLPHILGDYIFRIKIDLEKRLVLSLWNSPQWGGYKVCVHHYAGNMQRRLDPTMGAWMILHAFYRIMSDKAKRNIRTMLLGEGVTKASDAILESELFDSASNRFRRANDDTWSDEWTAKGCAALFYTAIVPNTGALAIPIISEGTGTAYPNDTFNPTHFEFDYLNRTVKVPLYAGKVGFQFGTKLVEEVFPFDGIYKITFSQDWNSILQKTKVGDLTGLYVEKPRLPTPMEALLTTFGTMMTAFPIYALGKTLIKKTKESVS